jgi:trk system potassium uptake protein TrkA
MNILIAGAGHLGAQAAHFLSAIGHQVTVIDQDRTRLADCEHHSTVHGDACEPDVLERAGALSADILLACTGQDENNLVISLLAKRQFAISRVLARFNDPDDTWLFDHRWGIDVALAATAPMVSLIEEASGASDTIGLLRLASAGVTLIETHIEPGSATAGHTLADVRLPAETVVAAVVRNGSPTVPDQDFRFQVGDTVLVVTSTAADHDIHKAFQEAASDAR